MKIGIIGLGLIGGSILKNLITTDNTLYVVTRNKETHKKIQSYIQVCSDDYSILKDCEVVFVCTPIHKILETLDKIEQIVSQDCIVTDVASVKEFVTTKKRPYKFIPSHPMAGTENSGYDASFKDLFIGAKWVLTPYDCQDTDILIGLIKQMGAEPIISKPKEHDEAVALISHFPMYAAQCLFSVAKDNQLALKLASSGFRDTTRLAMSDLNLACDMLHFNKDNIEKAQKIFENELLNLKTDNYLEKITQIRKQRRALYSKDGKNIFEINDLPNK